jgi:hypothetical protein
MCPRSVAVVVGINLYDGHNITLPTGVKPALVLRELGIERLQQTFRPRDRFCAVTAWHAGAFVNTEIEVQFHLPAFRFRLPCTPTLVINHPSSLCHPILEVLSYIGKF